MFGTIQTVRMEREGRREIEAVLDCNQSDDCVLYLIKWKDDPENLEWVPRSLVDEEFLLPREIEEEKIKEYRELEQMDVELSDGEGETVEELQFREATFRVPWFRLIGSQDDKGPDVMDEADSGNRKKKLLQLRRPAVKEGLTEFSIDMRLHCLEVMRHCLSMDLFKSMDKVLRELGRPTVAEYVEQLKDPKYQYTHLYDWLNAMISSLSDAVGFFGKDSDAGLLLMTVIYEVEDVVGPLLYMPKNEQIKSEIVELKTHIEELISLLPDSLEEFCAMGGGEATFKCIPCTKPRFSLRPMSLKDKCALSAALDKFAFDGDLRETTFLAGLVQYIEKWGVPVEVTPDMLMGVRIHDLCEEIGIHIQEMIQEYRKAETEIQARGGDVERRKVEWLCQDPDPLM